VEPTFVLAISRLFKAYRAAVAEPGGGPHPVLRGLSLRVKPGELVTIEGARGTGKTTLLRSAAGLLRPDEGEVRWPALDARGGAPPPAVGMVADRAPTHAFLTVHESLAYAAAVREMHDHAASPDFAAVLDLAGLRGVHDVRIGLLTSAERARLVVALILVGAPQLVLIDDLDGGPDAVGRAGFARFLVRVAASGVAVVWTARAVGSVADASAAYRLEAGVLRTTRDGIVGAARPRRSLELDVPSAGRAAAMLAPRLPVVECRGPRLRVPLEHTTAEEVLAICRTLAIPVNASRVVREP
jgi:ABC-type multidrug transport system ATPase subunit